MKNESKTPVVALEDLVTIVCETFVESLEDLGYVHADMDRTVTEWYMAHSDKERKGISESILNVLEQEMNGLHEKDNEDIEQKSKSRSD